MISIRHRYEFSFKINNKYHVFFSFLNLTFIYAKIRLYQLKFDKARHILIKKHLQHEVTSVFTIIY